MTAPLILNNNRVSPHLGGMKQIPLILALMLAAAPVQAACYADYKAKQDNPLRLQYGVSQVPQSACSVGGALDYLSPLLAEDGWQLLNVLGVFDDSGLEQRRESAGPWFLRY